MKLKKEKINRLGVFIFYDPDGFVDDYVIYLLKSLKEVTNDLIIVSNSYLIPSEKKKLSKFSNKIMVRHNIGLDAGAFKEAYNQYKDYFKTFDELLLVNDTFFGPFVPFKTICQEMENKDLDFWGLTANYDSEDGYGFLPDNMIHSHIQTFFIAFRNTVLKSEAFNDYWQNYKISSMLSFQDVVTKHEIAFTYYLEQNGFKWDTYTNLDKYHSNNIAENFNCYAYCAYDLIKNCGCPIIKRKNFVFEKKDELYLVNGSDTRKSLEYIETNHLYDTNMIYRNILRLYNPRDLYYGLNANYIVKEEKKTSKKYAILFHLENEKYVNYYVNFLKNTTLKNIFVMTLNSNIKKILDQNNITVVDKIKFDSKQFDYIGLVNDTYLKKQQIPTVFSDNFDGIISNGLASEEYINGILNIFEQNKYLGMLLLPASVHSDYFEDYSNENNSINANPNCCWIRSTLFDLDCYDDFDFVNKYINLCKGRYFVGKIFNEKNLRDILTNYEYIIQNTYQSLRTHHETITNSISDALFHIRHTKCYIPEGRFKHYVYEILRKIKHKFF